MNLKSIGSIRGKHSKCKNLNFFENNVKPKSLRGKFSKQKNLNFFENNTKPRSIRGKYKS